MSAEFPPNNPRAELEARLTAFILGELPAHEAAALRQAMDEDAELAALYERLKTAGNLVREVAASPIEQTKEPAAPLRLSEERRQKLLAQFKTVAPKEFVRTNRPGISGRRLLDIAAVLTIMAVLAWLLLPSLARSKAKAMRMTVANNLKQIELAKEIWADENHKSADDVPTASDIAPYLGGQNGGLPRSIEGETYSIGKVGESPTADIKGKRRISLEDGRAVAKMKGDDRPETGLVLRQSLQSGNTTANVSKESHANKANLLESISLSPPPSANTTTIVLPPAQMTTAITTNALSGYSDISMEWNAGTGIHQSMSPFGRTQTFQADNDSPQNSQLYQRSQTLSSAVNSNGAASGFVVQDWTGHFANSAAAVAGGNAGPEVPIKYANPSDISAGLSQLAAKSEPQLSGGTVTSVTNSADFTGDPEWVALLEHPDRRHSDSNVFVGGGNFIARPPGEKLDIDSIHNQAAISSQNKESNYLQNQGIGSYNYGGLPEQIQPEATHKRNSEFRYYLDPNGNLAAVPTEAGKNGGTEAVRGMRFARLSEDGSLDTSFDRGNGVPVASPPATANYSTSPAVQPTVVSSPTPQVEIKAKFADVTRETNRDFEFNFQAKNNTNAGTFTLPPGGITQTYGGPIPGAFPDSPTSEFANAQNETRLANKVQAESWRTNSHFRRNVGVADGSVQQVSVNGWQTAAPLGSRDDLSIETNQVLADKGADAGTWSLYANDHDSSSNTNGSVIRQGYVNLALTTLPASAAQSPEPVVRAGEVDFADVPADQLLEVYGRLTGRTVLGASNLPSAQINLQPGTDRTRSEAIHDIEGALASNGIVVVNVGEKFAKAVPVQTAGTLGSPFLSNGFAFGDQKKAEKQSKEEPEVYALNPVGYVNVTVPASSSYASTNGVIDIATDEAVKRGGPDSFFGRFRGASNNNAAANGVYPALAEMGNVTVTVDPETKRVFFATDADNIQSITNAIIQLNRNGGANKGAEEEANHSPAYLTKLRELKALRKARELMVLGAAQASVEREMPTTPMVEVIEHADSKPTKNPTLRERVNGALTGKVTETAKIKIERDVTDVPGVSGQPAMTDIYDPYFIQTESEVIQSEKVLDQVIDRLKLNKAWASRNGAGTPLKTSETRVLLKKSLEITPERNSSLLDIKVKSDKPEEAAKIANTVAEVYADYRRQQREALIEGGAQVFKGQLAEQQKRIAKAEDELARLEKTEKPQTDTPLPKPAADAPIPQPEVTTSENAFSTFSLNVADVSFKLAAASLEKGQMPDPSTIRSEEFVNAFDYRDPEPAPGAPLGFAWERAQYPFAHNRDLLRFSVKTAAAGREAGRPMNIVLLLDKSGSMERADRVRIIHEALRVLATQLGPQDKLSVVTFARVARLWVDGLPGSQAGEVVNGLDKLTPEGGTNLEEAMRLAYETARRHYLAGGINRVVLLTDGAANLGNVNPASLNEKVEQHRKEGIALDCFGVGWEGYNDDLLEVLSRHGDGRYGFINTPEEAANGFAKQLAGALHVAAADVKVQVEFNPKRVTAYRQIGYAKHQLKKEQFRDNTVDAAEIGAAESGNALYVVEVNPNGEGPLATVRVRYKVPGTEDYPEHEWPVPYTGSATPLEQASPAMRLAGTASAFSELLATSPFAGEVTSDALLGLLRGVPETCGADERPKKLEWMIRQAKSLTGK